MLSRRGFIGALAAAPFVKKRKPSPQEIIARLRRKREQAMKEIANRIAAEMERDFWTPPSTNAAMGLPYWVVKKVVNHAE